MPEMPNDPQNMQETLPDTPQVVAEPDFVPTAHTVTAGAPKEVAPGVAWVDLIAVNAYLVGEPGGEWVIIDTGILPAPAPIVAAATARYGKDSHPTAIYLTHGHQDHVAGALALATYYNVPVYAHTMELPFLTGKADYPPFDPTIGGVFSLVVRTLSNKGVNLGEWIHPLPADGVLPGLAGWEVIETPGHSAGHVSFFRRSDRTLIAGDAFITQEQETLVGMVARPPRLHVPPIPATPDWVATRKSIRKLADLWPKIVAAGHGQPITGNNLGAKLDEFAEHYRNPTHGRYVNTPAEYDANGVTFLPPPVPDPFPKQFAIASACAVGAYLLVKQLNKKKKT